MKRFSTLLILLCFAVSSYAVDIIILKSSNKIEAIIQEVSQDEIKYKKSSNPDGPTFIISTSEISSIIYDGGDVQVFSDDNRKQTSDNRQQNGNSSNLSSFKLQDAHSFYSFTINYSSYKPKEDFAEMHTLNGFNAGLLMQNRLYRNLVLLWGVEYQFAMYKKGSVYEVMNHNVKIPLRLGFSMPFAKNHSATVFFGPSLDFNVSTTEKFSGRDFDDNGYHNEESGKIDYVSGKYKITSTAKNLSYATGDKTKTYSGKSDDYKVLKPFDIPLSIGAMYKYKNYGFRIQYEWGLVNRCKSDWASLKWNANQFTVGVLFSF